MNRNDCKGCFLWENNRFCVIRKLPSAINCPCQICIIKMMCNVACQDHMDYVNACEIIVYSVCEKENNNEYK